MHERVFQRTRERWHENLAFGIVPEGGSEASNEDARIGADGGFGVHLHLREMTEEFIVHYPVVELDGK